MGWVDWLLRPFQRRPSEADTPPDSTASATTAGTSSASSATATSAPPASKKKQKKHKTRRAVERPEAAPGEPEPRKRSKKARKHAAEQAPEPAAEVLSLAEAQQRYGALVTPQALPQKSDEAEPEPLLAPIEEPDEPDAPPPVPPPPRLADPAGDARRAEAAENRRRARLPQFQALLSRADALLAVAEAEPRHLASARRQLHVDWNKLGSPPQQEAAELLAARDARLAALDERLQRAAEAVEAVNQEKNARRWAIVEEARALAERDDLKGAGPAMGELRGRLRAVGRIEPTDPVSVAFAEAEARLKQRQEARRTERDEQRREQLERLEQLVLRAEALASSADPEGAAERIKSLQATWKTVRVPGPRTEVDAAWTRFRAACDAVFAARTAARAEAAKATLERMEAIVVRIEALAETGAEGDPDDEIAKAMTAWKRAGRAPREAQQVLWERLQRAFDHLRSPSVDLGEQDATTLQFRPFEGLVQDEG